MKSDGKLPYVSFSRAYLPIMGTSIRPVLAILPASAKTLVPLLFSVPMPAYHSAPLRMIDGMFAMVSNAMFREFFLDELVEEADWLDRSIYHLDGPGALRHLDTLLSIDNLDGIQFVYGAGNEPASRWMAEYRRIQNAGKVLHISIDAAELDPFMRLKDSTIRLASGVCEPRLIGAAEGLYSAHRSWTG